MFKLQRLEITGFKSFADYTEIVFTGNGITAVVGPNGCGKSNVSDSISWVLGEQRAKSLRGGEMKDVVFQGTKSRKSSGMAEVVLHLVRDEDAMDVADAELEDIDETLSSIDELAVDVDALEAEQAGDEIVEAVEGDEVIATQPETNGFHEDVEIEKVQAAQVGSIQVIEKTIKTKRHWRPRSFALDFAPGEAVAVTRRLYLSGESEYLLNGKTCRLRDIQDLFAGTGLSGSHYAIVEQGRIGQILSAKPGDRRNLIEEAAGISKFRTRQRAAESRLDSAKTNLGRISDIVSEIEKQANSLRRQASKTRRFVVLQEEFRILLRQLFAAEGKHLSSLIEDLGTQLGKAVEAENSFVGKVSEQENSVRTATQTAREAEEVLAGVRSQHAQNALERDRTEREHRYQSEQIISLGERLNALNSEIEAAEERKRLAESEHERLEIEEHKEGAEADASRLILIEAERQYGEKIGDVRKIEKEIEEARGELLKHTAAVERFDEIARQLSLNLDRHHERAAGLANESVRAEEAFQQHTQESGEIALEIGNERQKLDGLHSEKAVLIEETTAARQSLNMAEATSRERQTELARTKNRLETLQELEEKRAVYAPQVQKLFAEQANIGVDIRGVLADHLNVEERAERAVENLFGVYLQAVLVDSYADAKKLADWLRSTRTGRVPILIAPDVGEAEHGAESVTGARTVADALGTTKSVLSVLREAFPRELSASLVESLNGEPAAHGAVVVDLAGDMLVGGSLMVSGNAATNGKNESLLAFKRELSVLAKSADRLAGEVAMTESAVLVEREKLTEIEDRTVDLQSVIIKVERHLLSLEIQQKNLTQEIERAERHKRVVGEETDQIKSEISEIEAKILEARESRTVAESSRGSAEEGLERIGLRLAEAREQADADNSILNEKRTLAATSGERRRSVQSALQRVEIEIKELGFRIGNLRTEVGDAESRIAKLRASVDDIKTTIGEVDVAVAAELAELEAAMSAVALARQTSDKTVEMLSELNRQAADAMNERASIEVRQTEAVTNLKNISENCIQELNIPLAELTGSEEVAEDFELSDARERSDDLRQRLESFGAINMLAVDELTEAEERLLFLTSQRQDIIDSISSAEEALREIKHRSRERFRHAFEAINENFKEFFSELFGGGRGEMALLESEDILEAGIEVSAQPPGKRLQNILLLSGGEKAMTAIALVLAIFKYRPSPFCLLDEVDAPLDDANVGRFVSKIADMSEKTQFIVITHNKRTMEAARALYGVTMQEAGVSKVVSVRFE